MRVRVRLTTMEVARRLDCDRRAALALLRKAGVKHWSTGKKTGGYLWEAAGVDRLIDAKCRAYIDSGDTFLGMDKGFKKYLKRARK